MAKTGLARNLLLLAEFTGWSEADILSMPQDRVKMYIKELNGIIEERSED